MAQGMAQGTGTYSPQKSESKSDTLRVLVGLSGGIHSAVTAALLKTQGHEVIGAYLDVQMPGMLSGVENHCFSGNARADAEKAAAILGIELQFIDVSELYELHVMERLVHDAAVGHSPNPCVPCNRQVRLAGLFQKAAELRCDQVATGHGAQLLHDPRTGMYQLFRAIDPERDQSFFLFSLSQAELSRLMLPLGNFPKAMVARLGAEYGFPFSQTNSQKVCFSSAEDSAPFIESRLAPSLRPRGVIRTTKDQFLGEHEGLYRFRVGQKPAIESNSEEVESYVIVGMDVTAHALILGNPEHLLKKECLVTQTHWMRPEHPLRGTRCFARLRPDGAPAACQLTFFENHTIHAEFDEPQTPLFPGQTIVFYQENEVLGGGWIRTTS